MARHHDAAGTQKQQVLQHHVIDEVHQAAGHAQRGAERQRHGDVAELAHGAVDQQALDADLHDGHGAGVQQGDAADVAIAYITSGMPEATPRRSSSAAAAEHHEQLQHTVGAASSAAQQKCNRRPVSVRWPGASDSRCVSAAWPLSSA